MYTRSPIDIFKSLRVIAIFIMLTGFCIKYCKSQSYKLPVTRCFLHLQSTALGVTLEDGAAAPKHVGKGIKHVQESF